jgi:hypothetical protein
VAAVVGVTRGWAAVMAFGRVVVVVAGAAVVVVVAGASVVVVEAGAVVGVVGAVVAGAAASSITAGRDSDAATPAWLCFDCFPLSGLLTSAVSMPTPNRRGMARVRSLRIFRPFRWKALSP